MTDQRVVDGSVARVTLEEAKAIDWYAGKLAAELERILANETPVVRAQIVADLRAMTSEELIEAMRSRGVKANPIVDGSLAQLADRA